MLKTLRMRLRMRMLNRLLDAIAIRLMNKKYILQYLGQDYLYDVESRVCWCGEQYLPDWGWLDIMKAKCPYPPRSFVMKCPKHGQSVRAEISGGQRVHDAIVNATFEETTIQRHFVFQTQRE